ncbi:MAG: hypothetical protein WC815_03175 [Vicinamibacterales bacterium]|jgi:hypothetical protein
MTTHIEHLVTGVAKVSLGGHGRRLTYRCDPLRHRVTISDEFERLLHVFGERGRGPGQFNTPLDLAFVRPEFSGEWLPASGPDALWLAVADYGNQRIQILELDGVFVGDVNPQQEVAIGPPCALGWRAPFLEVEGVEGARTRIHLTSALLGDGPRTRSAPRPPREWLPTRMWVN